MKTLILALLLCSTAQAKEFRFTFYFPYGTNQNKLQYKTDAFSQEEAYRRASQFCFDFFTKKEANLTEEKGLDIIDTCVNPR